MKRLILLLPLVLLVAAFMVQRNGKLAGTVTDKTTGTAVSGVEIVIDGTDLTASSDDQGRYYILNIPDGAYQVSAKHDGYTETSVDSVTINSSFTRELNFSLAKE